MKRRNSCITIAGYTLIELVVAMFLGVVVSAAALELYLSSQQSSGMQTSAAQTQDNGRELLNLLKDDLRRAGETPSDSAGVTTQSVGLPSEVVQGNSSWPSTVQTPPDTDPISGSDAFAVSYYEDATQTAPTDCNGYVTTVVGGISQITNIYYVAKSSAYSNTNPVLSLWCIGNGQGSTAQELAQGVDVMRVLYGLDNNVDGVLAPSIWVSDPNSLNATSPSQIPVVGARVGLLVRSNAVLTVQPVKTAQTTAATPAATMQVLDCVVPSANCGSTVNLADGRLRRLFIGTTLLRNNLFPATTQW